MITSSNIQGYVARLARTETKRKDYHIELFINLIYFEFLEYSKKILTFNKENSRYNSNQKQNAHCYNQYCQLMFATTTALFVLWSMVNINDSEMHA